MHKTFNPQTIGNDGYIRTPEKMGPLGKLLREIEFIYQRDGYFSVPTTWHLRPHHENLVRTIASTRNNGKYINLTSLAEDLNLQASPKDKKIDEKAIYNQIEEITERISDSKDENRLYDEFGEPIKGNRLVLLKFLSNSEQGSFLTETYRLSEKQILLIKLLLFQYSDGSYLSKESIAKTLELAKDTIYQLINDLIAVFNLKNKEEPIKELFSYVFPNNLRYGNIRSQINISSLQLAQIEQRLQSCILGIDTIFAKERLLPLRFSHGPLIAPMYAGKLNNTYQLAYTILSVPEIDLFSIELDPYEKLFLYLFIEDVPQLGTFTSLEVISSDLNISVQAARRLCGSVVGKLNKRDIRIYSPERGFIKLNPNSSYYNLIQELERSSFKVDLDWQLTQKQIELIELIEQEKLRHEGIYPSVTKLAQITNSLETSVTNLIGRILAKIRKLEVVEI